MICDRLGRLCWAIVLIAASCDSGTSASNKAAQPKKSLGLKLLFQGEKIVDRDSGQEVTGIPESVDVCDILVGGQCSPSMFVRLLDGIVLGHGGELRIKVALEELRTGFEVRLPHSHEVTIRQSQGDNQIPRGRLVFVSIGANDTIAIVGALDENLVNRETESEAPPTRVAALDVGKSQPWSKVAKAIQYLQRNGIETITFRTLGK